MERAQELNTSKTRKNSHGNTHEQAEASLEPIATCRKCSGKQTRRYRQAPLIQIGGDDTYDNLVGRIVIIYYLTISLSQSIAAIFKAG